MPTTRIKSKLAGLAQKFILTPADNSVAMANVLDSIFNSSFERRWKTVYESSSGDIDITQGSPEIIGSGTSFTDYLGDVWIAFGSSGFTPTKFYKIEAVHSDSAIRLEHFITESTAGSQYYIIVRPIRYTIEFEAGNYDFESFPDHDCSNAACVSMVGVSTDAQLFFDSSVSLQALVNITADSGELNVKRLSLYSTQVGTTGWVAQQPIRLNGGVDSVFNLSVERCYLQTPHTDFIAGAGAGTILLRNNHGIVGYDGIIGIIAPDKLFVHGNVLRSPATHANGHGKTGVAVILNNKGGTFSTREVWVHGNKLEIIDDGSVSTATLGISCKVSGTAPAVSPNFISSHNHIVIDSEQTGTETRTTNFAAGIYSWEDAASPAASVIPNVQSHGDVIDLNGGATNLYGYKSHGSRVSIWNRPDTHGIKKTSNGTIYDDGVSI